MNCSNFVLSVVLFCSFSFHSFANNFPNSILDNSEITWAAEAFTFYAPSLSTFTSKKQLKDVYKIEGRNAASPMKIIQDMGENNLYQDPKNMTSLLMNLDGSKTNIYSDSDLKNKYTHQEYRDMLASVDTIVTFDPKTFQEIVQVYVSVIRPKNIQSFKVKQILHYNAKTHQLDVTPIAIAPMVTKLKADGSVASSTPLFWISINDISEALDLNDPAIDFAIRMGRSIHQSDMKVIKGKGKIGDIIFDIMENARENKDEVSFYHTFGQMTKMKPNELEHIGSGIDTIITFEPVTFKEIVQVVTNKLDPKHVETVRLIQDWYWNKEEQKLSIRLLAFAPIVRRYDNQGNFLNSGPMFYKRPNEL